MKTALLALALSLGPTVAAVAAPVGLDDVAVLLPLPASADDPELLTPATQGDGGSLLPPDALSLVPRLLPTGQPEASLKVVGFRLDPCFPGPDPVPPAVCR